MSECCRIEGCTNQGKLHRKGYRFYPRGFCNTHYKKWCKENRDIIEEDNKPVQNCSVDGCKNTSPYKKGLCELHYSRFNKYGDPLLTTRIIGQQTSHPLYNTYGGMKKRCLNPEDKDYPKYGGRGIKICERWLGKEGFFNFIEDMGERPEGYTLDRKDNNGNYEPSNCRWADSNTQAINRSTSAFKGVSYYAELDKYRARISVDGISYELGMFSTLEEATFARKQGELKYLGYTI